MSITNSKYLNLVAILSIQFNYKDDEFQVYKLGDNIQRNKKILDKKNQRNENILDKKRIETEKKKKGDF